MQCVCQWKSQRTLSNLDLLLIVKCKWQKVMQKAARWPCGVCGRRVGNNSIQCTSQKWIHRKCSTIKGSMSKVMKSFICKGCVNPVTNTGHTSVNIGVSANLELVDKFCYFIYLPSSSTAINFRHFCRAHQCDQHMHRHTDSAVSRHALE